jgi:16S rRNA processing protein RimM
MINTTTVSTQVSTKNLRFVGIVSRPLATDGTFILAETERHFSPIQANATVYIGYSAQFTKAYTLVQYKKHGTGYAMKLKEMQSPESIHTIKEQAVYVEEAMLQKKEHEYYVDEVIGCTVIDSTTHAKYGLITDVWTLPANDVWVMQYQDKEIPIPVLPHTIVSVNTRTRQVHVLLLDGLLSLFDNDDRDDEE